MAKLELTIEFMGELPFNFRLQHEAMLRLFTLLNAFHENTPLEKVTISRTGMDGLDILYTFVAVTQDGRTFTTDIAQNGLVHYKPSTNEFWSRESFIHIADIRDVLMELAKSWPLDALTFELG